MPRDSIDTLRLRLASASGEEIGALLRQLERDPRSGVRELAAAARRRVDRQARERSRLDGLMEHQAALHALGYAVVAGTDEVGRGALAGPVTAAAVIMDITCRLDGLDDSKKLLPRKREVLAARIREACVAVTVAHVEPAEIDSIGIGPASRLAMTRALTALHVTVDHVLVDGNDGRVGFPSKAVIKGDSLCACIAAASVVAKVERDALMVALAVEHPGYGLEVNKGYSTVEHLSAIRLLGPSAIHRRSFAPCAEQGLLF